MSIIWYQSFWFTQLLLITCIAVAFFAFVFSERKRWQLFITFTLVCILFSGISIYYKIKLQDKKENYKVINYHFKSVKDLSDFEADKYSAAVVVEDKVSKDQTKMIIQKAIKQVLAEKKDAVIVWLSVFDDDNSEFENIDENNKHFIAQGQWKRKAYNGPLPDSFISNEEYKDIRIYFNPRLIK